MNFKKIILFYFLIISAAWLECAVSQTSENISNWHDFVIKSDLSQIIKSISTQAGSDQWPCLDFDKTKENLKRLELIEALFDKIRQNYYKNSNQKVGIDEYIYLYKNLIDRGGYYNYVIAELVKALILKSTLSLIANDSSKVELIDRYYHALAEIDDFKCLVDVIVEQGIEVSSEVKSKSIETVTASEVMEMFHIDANHYMSLIFIGRPNTSDLLKKIAPESLFAVFAVNQLYQLALGGSVAFVKKGGKYANLAKYDSDFKAFEFLMGGDEKKFRSLLWDIQELHPRQVRVALNKHGLDEFAHRALE